MKGRRYFSAMSVFEFPRQTNYYKGKVREVYTIDDQYLVMIASDRISAFDVILPRPIPYKGQVLNQIAAYMLERTRDICPNWLLDTPAPNVSIGLKCEPIRIEMVVRGNLVGHAWRVYAAGGRTLCGATLPEGLRENDFFPEPIITPSTKAQEGHDEDITPPEILARGMVTVAEWEKLSQYSLQLFQRGKQLAQARELILADTKYEFGKIGDTIYLMDEVHTPDSSRYFHSDAFVDRQVRGEKQQQLSKEFVREWLLANDFMGKPGQAVPAMSDEWVEVISKKYTHLYELLIGEPFVPMVMNESELEAAILDFLGRQNLG